MSTFYLSRNFKEYYYFYLSKKITNTCTWIQVRKLGNSTTCSICFDFVKKGLNFTKYSFDIVANGNNVEATFDFVERIIWLAAFGSVASTLLLVWTGLYIYSLRREAARSWRRL